MSTQYLNPETVSAFVRSNGARFLTVVFDKTNGEQRQYNGRANIRKHLKQNDRGRAISATHARTGTVPIITSGGYKAFKLDRVRELRLRGEVVTPENFVDIASKVGAKLSF